MRGVLELVDAADLVLCEVLVADVLERRSTPEGKCLLERKPGLLGLGSSERAPSIVDERREPVEIELVRGQVEVVAAPACDESAVTSEGLAQTRDVSLQRLGGRRGRLRTVEVVDQPVGGYDITAVYEQDGEQGALTCAAEIQRAAVVLHLQWAKDPEVHVVRRNRL